MSAPGSTRVRRLRRAVVMVIAVTAVSVLLTWLLNGDHAEPATPGRVEGITDQLARRLPDDHPMTRFDEATEAFGLDVVHGAAQRASLLPEDMGPGCALDDLDGDGDLDLFLVGLAGNVAEGSSGDARPPATGSTHRLFRNDGGRFTEVTAGSGIDVRDFGIGVAAGDVDGDGDLDLYVTCYGRNRLFRNQGGLRFEDVTEAAGVGDDGFGAGAAFADVDRDGDLDLYVCNYVAFSWDGQPPRESRWGGYSLPYTLNPSSFDPQPNRFYVNRGDGTFEEKAAALGIADPKGKGLACTFADFSDDGWPDLYVLNDVSKNAYFENRGDGTFEDRSLASFSADYRGAMGNAVADVDGDGDLDFFVTHWIAQENGYYVNLVKERNRKPGSNRPLIFGDQADTCGLGACGLPLVGWGCAFIDYDLDGVRDLVVVNGSTMPSTDDPTRLKPQRPQLFWHKPEGGFFETAGVGGEVFGSARWCARGLADGDLDGDGDRDLVITENHGPVHVLRNAGPTGHWVTVRLRQPRGNRFAVGAQVSVIASGRRVLLEVGAGTSYLCHRPYELTFGLGEATSATCEVRWPDGTTTQHEVTADRVVELTHDPGR